MATRFRSWYRAATLAILVVSLLLLVGCGLLPGAPAPQPAKPARVGLLAIGSGAGSPNIDTFRQSMRDLGWIEDQTFLFEPRFAAGREERLPELAAELAAIPVDVIVAVGTPAIRAARDAGPAMPVVMAISGDPVETGLVQSLARPGGNVTGLTTVSSQLGGKRLELVKEMLPGAVRVAVLWNPTNSSEVEEFTETETAAHTLGVELKSLEVRQPSDFEPAFLAASSERADTIIVVGDPLTQTRRGELVELAARYRLPAMYETREFVDTGGLMAYGPSLADLYRRSAGYVDRILKGTRPADLPVEQPTRFDLFVNLTTAQGLGITIPQSVLARAQEIIQ